MDSEASTQHDIETTNPQFRTFEASHATSKVREDAEDGNYVESSLGKRKRASSSDYLTPAKYILWEKPNFLYIETLNEAIRDATRPSLPRFYYPATDTQVGLTHWSVAEKEQVFDLLQREPWRASRLLPSTLTSKSDIEILRYLQHLREYMKGYAKEKHPSEAKAAWEISDACCEALDKQAHVLAAVQWDFEWEQEQDKFGYYAVLTHDLVKEVEIASGVRGPGQWKKKRLPVQPGDMLSRACQFFHLRNWLDISEQFYMPGLLKNEVSREEHIDLWYERPSIFATAFTDFYNVAVSVTRRLISVATTQAWSRLRATQDESHNDKRNKLEKKDVLAALDILSMDYNSVLYWRNIARRLGTEVYRHSERVSVTRPTSIEYKGLMDYDEVEENLAIPYEASWSSPEPEDASSDDLDESSTESENALADLPDDTLADEEDQQLSNEASTDKLDDDEETEALEGEDAVESTREEERLWKLLTENRSTRLRTMTQKAEDRLYSHRTATKTDLSFAHQWSDHVDFRSEWERYGYTLTETEFPHPDGGPGVSSARFRRASKTRQLQHEPHKTISSATDTDTESDADKDNDGLANALVGEGANTTDAEQDGETRSQTSGNSTNDEQSDVEMDASEDNDNDNDDDGSDGAQSQSSRRSLRRRANSQPNYFYEIPEDMPRSAQESDSEDEYDPDN